MALEFVVNARNMVAKERDGRPNIDAQAGTNPVKKTVASWESVIRQG